MEYNSFELILNMSARYNKNACYCKDIFPLTPHACLVLTKTVESVCRLVICSHVPLPKALKADYDVTNTTQLMTYMYITNILVSLKVSDKENIESKMHILLFLSLF